VPSPVRPTSSTVLISEFLSRPLVRTRPLWQLVIVEGLEDGPGRRGAQGAYALADGVSGAETFASLFDISPEVRAPAPKWTTRQANLVGVEFDVVRARRSSSICAPSRRSP